MSKDSSATTRERTPHANQTTRTNTIINALKRRAQAVLNDTSIDAQSRAIIRYGLETNDSWLAQLLNRVDAGENISDTFDFSQTHETNEPDSTPENTERCASIERAEALTAMICRAGDEAAGALFVLMGLMQNSPDPTVLAHTAKHLAFTRCGEFNLFGMVDAQVAVIESELFSR